MGFLLSPRGPSSTLWYRLQTAKWDSTCQMGQYMPNEPVYAKWDSICQMEHYMPNGTVHAKLGSTCQMGLCIPNGTLHAKWDSACQMKCFAVKSRPIVDQVSFNVKFPRWEISEN